MEYKRGTSQNKIDWIPFKDRWLYPAELEDMKRKDYKEVGFSWNGTNYQNEEGVMLSIQEGKTVIYSDEQVFKGAISSTKELKKVLKQVL